MFVLLLATRSQYFCYFILVPDKPRIKMSPALHWTQGPKGAHGVSVYGRCVNPIDFFFHILDHNLWSPSFISLLTFFAE